MSFANHHIYGVSGAVDHGVSGAVDLRVSNVILGSIGGVFCKPPHIWVRI